MANVQAITPRAGQRVELPGRAAMLLEIDGHIDNLKRCVHWLVEQGFAVLSVDMQRGRAKPRIRVAPAPRLHTLLNEDCANVGRRQDGAHTFYLWTAIRYGCDILWEEVAPCACA